MGKSASKEIYEKKFIRTDEKLLKKNIDKKIHDAFMILSRDKITIKFHDFKEKFGDEFGWDLWKYSTGGADEKFQMDFQQFSCYFPHLFENSDNFIEVLLTPENIFKISASSCGIEIDEQDSFFNDLLAKLETISSSSAELLQWKDQNCPRLFDSIQAKFLNILNMDFEDQSPVCKTDILSPFQLWFLQRSLPLLYFNDTRNSQLFLPETKKKGWDVLYSSKYEGLSAARFQAKVFDYRGATVTVICLENNSIYVIAIDQEWRNCGTCFGSNDSVFFQLSPRFIRVAKPSSFYCNLKFRSLPMKISFDKYFILDNAFHGVSEIEVFGCSGEDALIKQKDLKRREACQIEKNKKVSLPSTWDENPDRILLELGGLYSTANRREVFSRSDQ